MTETTYRLLIVDDEEEIRANLCDFAEFKGYEVYGAGNGQEAMERIEEHAPHLVLSDLMMPVMNGIQLLEELARRQIDTPLIIMTAFGTMEYAINAMKKGAADFITKPIDLPYLIKVIQRVLQHSLMEQRIKEQQRQLDEDLRHAARIQRCMLSPPIETAALSVHYRYQPLIAIGGDYLTLHRYNDAKIAAALYDVSGHGVSAALTAGLVHFNLQQRLSENRPPHDVIDLVNDVIVRNIGETSMFITMIIAMIDTEASTLTVCNAGHPDLFVWKRDSGQVQTVHSQLTPIGFTPKILGDKCDVEIPLASGDRIVFYTDGFIETRNADGEMLGKQGMQAWVEENHRLGTSEFIARMFESLSAYHSGEPEDDLTLMAVDIK